MPVHNYYSIEKVVWWIWIIQEELSQLDAILESPTPKTRDSGKAECGVVFGGSMRPRLYKNLPVLNLKADKSIVVVAQLIW